MFSCSILIRGGGGGGDDDGGDDDGGDDDDGCSNDVHLQMLAGFQL
jgi:hypothetical protein